ncbi:MAG: theronine dehydrogenase [Myxococcales bacterium]|nr:theronine dehydrogenase [Myxococcales bacterium]
MESFDTWKLVSLSPLPAVALVLLVAALALGVGLACWGVRNEASRRRRWVLWTLRVAAGLCALFFLLEPGMRRLQVARVKNRVAVLVDRSASMGFPVSPKGLTRSAAVAQALEALGPQFDALKDRYAFEVYGFDPELGPVNVDALKSQPPTAGKSDLFAALRAVQAGQSAGGRKLSGVILFSDGVDNVDLSAGLSGRPRAVLEKFGVPVSTVAVGKGSLTDLAIATVKVDDFAFVRNSVSADVEIHARGFKGQAVQVVLRREGQVVGTQNVTFGEDDDTQPVRFTFTPDQTGRFVYTVSVPVFPDEAVVENNVKSFALKVIRDRVRVLLVAGRPTWDERFLRGLLRQDANVELISFYILRSSNEASGAQQESRELSLIPFPKDEIFQKKINTFDLIFVLNFGNEDPQTSLSYFRHDIESYVTNGGALAYLGGDRSFGEARGGLNPLDGVLPVTTAGSAELEAFQPRLTADGLRHPITALGTGGLSTEAVWAGLPKIPGMNLVRPRPGATVLLDHPFSTVDGKNAPLLAIQEVGRGRTLTLATDAAWYWAFPSHAQGAPTRAYERFWSNAIRWLVRDPDLTALSVAADPPSVEPGRPVAVVVGARTQDYQPAPGASISIELLSAEDGRVVGQATALAGPDGTARLELPAPPPGAYKVIGRATKDGKTLGESTDAVAVRAVGPELSDARVNGALLSEIAKATGGAFFDTPSFSLSDVPLLEPPLVEVGRSRDQPLWDRWYWLTLLVLVVGAEWAVRRRFGYI